MAGKSGKGRNRKGAHHATNNSEAVVSSDASKDVKNDALESKAEPVESVEESSDIKADIKESETAAPESQPKQGVFSSLVQLVLYQGEPLRCLNVEFDIN